MTAKRWTRWGDFNELQKLVRGVLAPSYLLDYLRYFVLFEDDGALLEKIAGYHQFHAVRFAIAKVIEASRPGGNQKGGVVWNTQYGRKQLLMSYRQVMALSRRTGWSLSRLCITLVMTRQATPNTCVTRCQKPPL